MSAWRARDVECYRCVACSRKFVGKPGPTLCPYCGSKYVSWCSYKWAPWPWLSPHS